MKLLHRIQYWLNQRRAAAELAEEIESHRLMRQEELEQSGMSKQEAFFASKRAMGNAVLAADQARDVWIWSWLDQLVRDTRIGTRALMKIPGFTISATLILSVGIGAMVTVFTYSNLIFFKVLRIPNPASFVRVYATEGVGRPSGRINYSNYEQYRDRNRSFAEIGLLDANAAQFPLRLNGPGTRPVDFVQSSLVNDGLFKAIGVSMVLGRGIEAGDQRAGAPNVAVLNEEAWRRYFADNPTILNKIIYLNNTAYTIVGVAPKSFEDAVSLFPIPTAPQVFLAVRDNAPPKGAVEVAGRLAPGVSRTAAQADFSRISAQLSLEQNSTVRASVERADLPPSWLLSSAAVLVSFFFVVVCTVLLIACDDIAIMLFARILARQREMGIRVALGGSRLQLIRQLLAENLLLSILGGVGAMIFILLSSRVIERLLPIPLPDISRTVFDWRVLTFTIFASLSTTLFFGLRPALQGVSRDVAASLAPGSNQRQGQVRSNLVVAQIAVCTAMLITAAVVTRSTQRQVFTVPGLDTEHVWLNDISFIGTSYSRDSQLAFYRQLAPRLMAAPGIVSVSIGSSRRSDRVKTGTAGGVLEVLTYSIDDQYFRALQVPLVRGRGFREQDNLNSGPVGILNQKMATALFGTQSPIGQIIRTGNETPVEIVGVVRDIKYNPYAASPVPILYRPLYQLQTTVSGTVTVMVKFSRTAAAANQIIHDTVSKLDSSLFVYRGQTMDDSQSAWARLPSRIIGYAIGIPAVFALLLGIIGTYGTMAILVEQRRREVGIRIALGARPSIAVRAILREGMKSVFIGVGFGIAAVVIILLWLSRNIGDVEFFDPIAFAIMTFAVIATAGTACYIPAKRASRVDPMIVLRED